MRIVRGLQPSPPDLPPSVVALGAFDGIHLAHQTILDLAVARAHALGASGVACTFDPHPLQVLRPGQAPEPIATLAERLELIAARGIDVTVVIPFTLELSQVEPEAFVEEVLVGTLRAREIVVGFNHTFGRGARGDARLLQSLAPRLGFRAHVIPPLEVGGTPVSSSAVREALRVGDVALARRLLGRPWTVRGVVVRTPGGETKRIEASVVIDASGGLGPLARRRGGRELDRALLNIAVYGYFEGLRLPEDVFGPKDEPRTGILLHPLGWIWKGLKKMLNR